MRLLLLVRAYQVMGHLSTQLDPLGLDQRAAPRGWTTLSTASRTDLDAGSSWAPGTWRGSWRRTGPSARCASPGRLRETYCGPNIGYEYMHINDRERCKLDPRAHQRPRERESYSRQKKMLILDRLSWSELLVSFSAINT